MGLGGGGGGGGGFEAPIACYIWCVCVCRGEEGERGASARDVLACLCVYVSAYV